MAPATGILVHAMENFQPRADMRMARISLDIHGIIHGGEFEVRTRMIRPGRTIELIEGEMISQGRTCIVARGWRLKTLDSTAVAASEDEPVVHPEELVAFDGMTPWPGGYIQGLEFRGANGHRPGKGVVWMRNAFEMVEGIKTPPTWCG